MRFPPLLVLFSTLVLFSNQSACSQQSAPELEISGQIKLHVDWQPRLFLVKPLYYRQLFSSYEGKVIDTIPLAADGSFDFRLSGLEEKGIYLLFSQPNKSRFPNEIAGPPPAENYIALVLEPKTRIQLEAKSAALTRSYKLKTANPASHQIALLRTCREPLYTAFDPLYPKPNSLKEWNTHGSTAAQKQVDAAIDTFIDSTQFALPLFAALRLRAGDNEFRDRPEFFLKVLDRLRELSPEHPWVEQLGFFLQPSRLPVLLGERMPDFSLPTPAGDTLNLSKLRSKLLLVDFWASWCAPCRKEIQEVIRPLYDQYQTQGFNVLGVSIDRSRTAWEAAIEKDGAIWPNVSDLLGDPSPVRQSLKFEYIPANYLLDIDGQLLARNIHGDELKTFIQEYLEQQ